MPKFNPKRKGRSQRPETPPPNSSEKKGGTYKGTYKGRSSKLTKFYGVIIIAAIATGLFFLFDSLNSAGTPTIDKWDHVELRLTIWIYPKVGKWDESMANVTTLNWYNFTTIYEESSDTNTTIARKDGIPIGLPIGIYEEVRYSQVGIESRAIMINNCIDADKDKKDDTTGETARGWGFPETHEYYNTTIVVKFMIITHHPHS
jgi:hypothetical protein